MSRFYFSWYGNKRKELHHLDGLVDFRNYDTIVEPFCGSAALSLERHAVAPATRVVLNDTDPSLVGLLRYVQEHGSAPLYAYCRDHASEAQWTEHMARAAALEKKMEPLPPELFFYSRRMVSRFQRRKWTGEPFAGLSRTARHASTDACLASATITLGDWRACVDAHKDDPRALIFLDPPYFSSFNQAYYGGEASAADDGRVLDVTHLFLEVLSYLKTCAARVVMISNSCAVLDHVYGQHVCARYKKVYARGRLQGGKYVRKYTQHIVVDGGGVLPLTASDLQALLGDLYGAL